MPTSAASPPASWRQSPSPASCQRNRHQHFLLAAGGLPWLLALLRSLALRAGPADALAQRLHQIEDVLAARRLLRHDQLTGALLVDVVDQRRFVLVLELVGLESPRLLVHDVLG